MEKIKMDVVGLTYNAIDNDMFLLVLGVQNSDVKLPIMIEDKHAKEIVNNLNNINNIKIVKSPFDTTYNLFKNITNALGADLHHIYISHLLEGIYYTKIYFNNMAEEFSFDCAIGDAVCLSLTYNCPIFCSSEILSMYKIDDSGDKNKPKFNKPNMPNVSNISNSPISIDGLEKLLKDAEMREDYESCLQIKKQIDVLKRK